ncbi:MAG: phosphotransferase family protein [Nostocoides sp.]
MSDQPSSKIPSNAQGVRDEDAFDVTAMAAWLRHNAAEPICTDGTIDGTPEVRQFVGGASNLTYLLSYAGRDFILRRPPGGTKAKGAHDMPREHNLQAALKPVYPYVPTMVALCEDEAVIGSTFYVMERVEGTILRTDIPPGLGLDEAGIRRLCETAIDRLADLHDVDVEAAGLAHLSRGEGYVARQVGGWNERYRRARTPDVDPLEDVMGWLDAHQPPDAGMCLIHNDFRFDNMVLDAEDPTRIRALLDWELATVGDPLMDLAGALAYWVQADDDPRRIALRLQPTHATGMLTRHEVVAAYGQRTGRTIASEDWTFYEVFGLFRLAVIGQQIYYRFFHGQTTNAAYGRFGEMVRYLGTTCQRILQGAP